MGVVVCDDLVEQVGRGVDPSLDFDLDIKRAWLHGSPPIVCADIVVGDQHGQDTNRGGANRLSRRRDSACPFDMVCEEATNGGEAMPDPIEIVNAWHESVNAGDSQRLAELVSDDVEIGGPRGIARGLQDLTDWVDRTHIRMEPAAWYQRGETVIVCQYATWLGEDGTPGDPQPVASVFVVRGNRITSISRHADQIAAFAASGLAETDRVWR
jgi:hypothetical protein